MRARAALGPLRPEVVLRVGAPPASRALGAWLAALGPTGRHVRFDAPWALPGSGPHRRRRRLGFPRPAVPGRGRRGERPDRRGRGVRGGLGLGPRPRRRPPSTPCWVARPSSAGLMVCASALCTPARGLDARRVVLDADPGRRRWGRAPSRRTWWRGVRQPGRMDRRGRLDCARGGHRPHPGRDPHVRAARRPRFLPRPVRPRAGGPRGRGRGDDRRRRQRRRRDLLGPCPMRPGSARICSSGLSPRRRHNSPGGRRGGARVRRRGRRCRRRSSTPPSARPRTPPGASASWWCGPSAPRTWPCMLPSRRRSRRRSTCFVPASGGSAACRRRRSRAATEFVATVLSTAATSASRSAAGSAEVISSGGMPVRTRERAQPTLADGRRCSLARATMWHCGLPPICRPGIASESTIIWWAVTRSSTTSGRTPGGVSAKCP